MDHRDVDLQNHQCIAEFLESTENSECDISCSVKATIAQFLLNFRLGINKRAKSLGQDWLYPSDVIDIQIRELRRCIIDLEAFKDRLKQGVTIQ